MEATAVLLVVGKQVAVPMEAMAVLLVAVGSIRNPLLLESGIDEIKQEATKMWEVLFYLLF